EAAQRSGALITATHAAEQGRTVLAVPGPGDGEASGGTNALIRQGAVLCRGADDVLEGLQGVSALATPARAAGQEAATPPPGAARRGGPPSDLGRLGPARRGVPAGGAAPPRRDGAAPGPAGGAAVGDAADDGDEAGGAPPPRQPLRACLTGGLGAAPACHARG